MKTRSGLCYHPKPTWKKPQYLDILEDNRWKKCENYYGPDLSNYFLISQVYKDDSVRVMANHDAIIEDLEAIAQTHNYGYDFINVERGKHWSCGWVEFLCLRDDSPEELLKKAVDYMESDCYVYNKVKYDEYMDEFIKDNWDMYSEQFVADVRPILKKLGMTEEEINGQKYKHMFDHCVRQNAEDLSWDEKAISKYFKDTYGTYYFT